MLVDKKTCTLIKKLRKERNLSADDISYKVEMYCKKKMNDIILRNNYDVKKIVAELKAMGIEGEFPEEGMEELDFLHLVIINCPIPYAIGEIDNLPISGFQWVYSEIGINDEKGTGGACAFGRAGFQIEGGSLIDMDFLYLI